MSKETEDILRKIIFFATNFWKEILLTSFFIFAAFFFFSPYQTAFVSGKILLLLALLGLIYLWVMELEKKTKLSSWRSSQQEADPITPIFFDDDEITESQLDKLNIVDDAKSFASQVLNNGSRNPIIFGLDAPWGSGKTSYLNLCEELVWKPRSDEVVVFRFRPMLFDAHKQDLATVFVSELIKTLRKEKVYLGELDTDLKKLFQSIKGFTLGGINLEFLKPGDSAGALLQDIREHSKLIEKKIIIIIDDLDRLYLEDIKAVLGVVRNVFYTENMTFILCYDSNSINTFETRYKVTHSSTFKEKALDAHGEVSEPSKRERYKMSREHLDNRMVNSYLEKFVQVKKSLIPSREQLLSLLKELITANDPERKASPHIKKLLEGVEQLFAPESFWRYQSLIGDVRKIKRVANFLFATGSDENIVGIDFIERDIEPIHLLRLVLIYINFPGLFQKIYFSETGGAKGFFSVIYKYSPGHNGDRDRYTNSIQFYSYLETLSEEESFLLHELFCTRCAAGDCKRQEWSENGIAKNQFDDENFQKTSPMFNGHYGTNKNLEDYLTIIHDHRLRSKGEYYAFHKNRIRELEDKTVVEIFEENEEYGLDKGEKPRDQFIMAAHTKEVPLATINKVVEYIVKNVQHYSMMDSFSSGVYNGIRDDLVRMMIHILELRGWSDEEGRSYNNSEERNIAILATRILDSEPSIGMSILDGFLDETHHPLLSVIDAQTFMRACLSADSVLNVRRALENYARDRSVNVKESVSRKIFSKFRERYIVPRKNVLREVANMDQSILLGDFSDFIVEEHRKKEANFEDAMDRTRTGLIRSVVYQFAHEESWPVQFTESQQSQEKICDVVRRYLFDVCFNINMDIRNAELFMNYVLAGFEHETSFFRTWKPSVSALNKALGEERLSSYWQENHEAIKRHVRSLPQETKVVTYNYIADYAGDLEDAIRELDAKLLPIEASASV